MGPLCENYLNCLVNDIAVHASLVLGNLTTDIFCFYFHFSLKAAQAEDYVKLSNGTPHSAIKLQITGLVAEI